MTELVEVSSALLPKARKRLPPEGFLTCLDFAGALAVFQLLCFHSAGPDPLAVSSALSSPLPTLSWCAVLLWAAEQLPLSIQWPAVLH